MYVKEEDSYGQESQGCYNRPSGAYGIFEKYVDEEFDAYAEQGAAGEDKGQDV